MKAKWKTKQSNQNNTVFSLSSDSCFGYYNNITMMLVIVITETAVTRNTKYVVILVESLTLSFYF